MVKQAIFDKKNILVTGGAGFLGSFLCDELVKNSKVICVDNFSSGSEGNIDHLLANPNFAFIKHDLIEPLDLENRTELEKFRIRFQGVQEIFHLACPTSPKNFESKKIDTVLANSLAVKNVLDIAVKYKAKFMHFSSSVVYGPRTPEIKTFNEDYMGKVNFTSPRSSYDEGKRFAETLVVNYRDVYDLDAKIARIFRTYGPRMRLNDGQMLPDFIFSALDNKDLVIYGDESFSSSFCYVSDIINGALKLMKSGERGPLNLGSELEYKIVDVAKMVIQKTGSKSKIVFHEPLLFMTPLGLPDIGKVKEMLGWFPIILLENGIQEMIDYIKAHKNLIGMEQRAF